MRNNEMNRNSDRQQQQSWRGNQRFDRSRYPDSNRQQQSGRNFQSNNRFDDSNGSFWSESDRTPYREFESNSQDRDREFYRGFEDDGRYSQTDRSNYGPEYGEMYPGAKRNSSVNSSSQSGSMSGRDLTNRERDSYNRDQSSGGQFRGVGPKNFSRSKERVIEDVNQKLTDDSRLDASDIEVDFENGEVVLRGQVRSRECKRCAEDLAEQVPGVRDVRNELRVGKSSMQREEKSEKPEKGVDSGTSKHRQNASNPDMRS